MARTHSRSGMRLAFVRLATACLVTCCLFPSPALASEDAVVRQAATEEVASEAPSAQAQDAASPTKKDEKEKKEDAATPALSEETDGNAEAAEETPTATDASGDAATDAPSSDVATDASGDAATDAPSVDATTDAPGDATTDASGDTSGDLATTDNGETESSSAQKEDDATADAVEESPAQIEVAVRIAGLDGEWAWEPALKLDEGSTAWDATLQALLNASLEYEVADTSSQDALLSVTRLSDGTVNAQDLSNGSSWRLYLNGERYQGSASTLVLNGADEVEWRYEMGSITVSVCVVGPGGTGTSYWISPTSVRIAANQSGWDASRLVFEQHGYGEGRLLSYTVGDNGSIQLDSLAALGENGITGESWQVFVNGVLAEQDIAHVSLRAGDSICWYYTGHGETSLPSFVAKTGAAAQNPVASVRIEGSVSQAWSEVPTSQSSLSSALAVASDVRVSGQTEAVVLLPASRTIEDPVSKISNEGVWKQSLAHMLDGKLRTGEGGRASLSLDGSLYYLDSMGAMVKLEVR